MKRNKRHFAIVATALLTLAFALPVMANPIQDAQKGYESGIAYLKAAEATMTTAASDRDRQTAEGLKKAQANLDSAHAAMITAAKDRDQKAAEGLAKAQANLNAAYAACAPAQAYAQAQARAGMISGAKEYVRIAKENLAACKDLAKANPSYASMIPQMEAAVAKAQAYVNSL